MNSSTNATDGTDGITEITGLEKRQKNLLGVLNLLLMSTEDQVIKLEGHDNEVFICAWHPSRDILASG
jgi:hypothetical protein